MYAYHRPIPVLDGLGAAGDGTSRSPAVRTAGAVASTVLALGGVAYAAHETYRGRTGRGAGLGAAAGASSAVLDGLAQGDFYAEGARISGAVQGLVLAPFAALGVAVVGVGIGLVARAVKRPARGLRGLTGYTDSQCSSECRRLGFPRAKVTCTCAKAKLPHEF